MFSARQSWVMFVTISYSMLLVCTERAAECRSSTFIVSADTCERDILGAILISAVLLFIDIVFMPPVMSLYVQFTIQ